MSERSGNLTLPERDAARRALVAHLLGWRPLRRNTLLGLASIGFPSGIIIHEIGIHASHGKAWAAPLSRPWLDNALVLDAAGKIRWQPLIEFTEEPTRDRWSAQIIAALAAVHPEVLTDAGVSLAGEGDR